MDKSTLIYDGKCSFCISWVGRLQYVTKDRVEYLASHQEFERFPQTSTEDYKRSIQLVDSWGNVFEGAEAVFRTLACVPRKTWPLWIYQNIPGFSFVAEWAYKEFLNIGRFLEPVTNEFLKSQ